jgi:hypothetical protein
VPNVSPGGGISYTPNEHVSGSFSLFGTSETAGKNPFDQWHGTTFSTEWVLAHSLADRVGAQTFGALYGIGARRTDIAADPRTVVGDILRGQSVPTTRTDTWALYYNASQFIHGDSDGGWGIFARFGLSDGNPNLERGRKARLFREVLRAPTEEAALQRIGQELDGPLLELTTPQERGQLHRWILAILRREQPATPRLHREYLLGGVAAALVIVLATFPIVVPYLMVSDPNLAVRLSHLTALTLLFLLGAWWGRVVGGRSIRIASGLTLLGVTLVLITIALGG